MITFTMETTVLHGLHITIVADVDEPDKAVGYNGEITWDISEVNNCPVENTKWIMKSLSDQDKKNILEKLWNHYEDNYRD